jgi:hypothetical protein
MLPLLLFALAFAPAAHALRCHGYIVHVGDYDYQLRQRCGEPFWTEARTRYEGYGTRSGPPGARSSDETVREVQYTTWYYNFGSGDFMVRLLFRDGHFVREERLSRGVEEIGTSCDQIRMTRGLTSGEVVAHCGEPAQRYVTSSLNSRTNPDPALPRLDRGNADFSSYRFVQDEDYQEDWIYDFGDSDTIYVAHFTNGSMGGFERRNR